MNIGDICSVVGLKKAPEFNGSYVEILKEEERRPMPTENGPVYGDWYGVGWIGRDRTGYLQASNLELYVAATEPNYGAMHRAIRIHLTGSAE